MKVLMDFSPRFSLAYVKPQQAQKHVTVNEALRRLDAVVSLAVKSREIAAEPAAPAEGDAYILPTALTGAAWSAYSPDSIAVFQDGVWSQITPKEGWRAWVQDTNEFLFYDGAAWAYPARWGVNAVADATDRLSVKSNAALFDAVDAAQGGSGDMQIKVNKEAAGDTASHVFQTGLSGRAEIGLAGDDDLHIKVSADGAAWTEAMNAAAADGKVSFPAGLAAPLPVADGGTGAGDGLSALNNLGHRIALGTIHDDSVAIADFGQSIFGATILAVSNSLGSGPTAFFFTRMATNPDMTTLFSGGANFTIGTGALTGATGADVSTNFSVGSDGKFYVENRRGFDVVYTLYVFR